METKALFAGTFDPFTIGHEALVKRALKFIDTIIIGIGENDEKKGMCSPHLRMKYIKEIFENEPRIKVLTYSTMTYDFAKTMEVDFILRGIRNISDYEYEKKMAETNRRLGGIETIFLFSEPEYEYLSSSLVRELFKYQKDISHLTP